MILDRNSLTTMFDASLRGHKISHGKADITPLHRPRNTSAFGDNISDRSRDLSDREITRKAFQCIEQFDWYRFRGQPRSGRSNVAIEQ
jgi:hypothetical protein